MSNSRVLCIDDEPKVLSALRRQLHGEFEVTTTSRPEDGLELLKTEGPFAVVLADMRMPGMDGVEVLEHVREEHPETVRVMLTGNSDQATAAEAATVVALMVAFSMASMVIPPEVEFTAEEFT